MYDAQKGVPGEGGRRRLPFRAACPGRSRAANTRDARDAAGELARSPVLPSRVAYQKSFRPDLQFVERVRRFVVRGHSPSFSARAASTLTGSADLAGSSRASFPPPPRPSALSSCRHSCNSSASPTGRCRVTGMIFQARTVTRHRRSRPKPGTRDRMAACGNPLRRQHWSLRDWQVHGVCRGFVLTKIEPERRARVTPGTRGPG